MIDYNKKIYAFLKKANINNPHLVMCDMIYYNNLYATNKLLENGKFIQDGGGDEFKAMELNYNGAKFKIYKSSINDASVFALHYNEDFKETQKCITILVYKKERYCSIHNIGYNANCFPQSQWKKLKDMGEYPSGNLLMKMVLKLIDSLKDHYKLKYIILQDNSGIKCGENNIKLGLSYTLKNGITWYGKFGFVPANFENNGVDKVENKVYNKNKNIMSTILVKECNTLEGLLIKSYKKFFNREIKYSKNKKEIDIYKNKLQNISTNVKDMLNTYKNKKLKFFLNYFCDNIDKKCNIYVNFYRQLAEDIGVRNFFGKSFIKFL